MALNANALITVEQLEKELGLVAASQTEKVEAAINEASSRIEDYCDRKLFFTAGIVEKVAGFGSFKLRLDRPPIVALTTITFVESDVDLTNVDIRAEEGILYRPGVWTWTAPILIGATNEFLAGEERERFTVTYDGGFVTPPQAVSAPPQTLPESIVRAAKSLATKIFRQFGRDPSISEERLGDWRVKYSGVAGTAGSLASETGLPDSIRAALDHYKRPVFA